MFATEPPPVVAAAPADRPADMVVVKRDTRSEVLASRDLPLPLIKANRTEDAVLRQSIFLTAALTVARPTAGTGADVLRWTYEAYLQRQLCFTSITGQFSCATAEVEELTEKAAGEAPLAAGPGEAAAEGARTAVATALRTRATAIFEDDRRLKVSPMLKAAGVSLRRVPASAAPLRR